MEKKPSSLREGDRLRLPNPLKQQASSRDSLRKKGKFLRHTRCTRKKKEKKRQRIFAASDQKDVEVARANRSFALITCRMCRSRGRLERKREKEAVFCLE